MHARGSQDKRGGRKISLAQNGVDVNLGQATANWYTNPLNAAVKNSHYQVVRQLIDARAYLDARHIPYTYPCLESRYSLDLNRGKNGMTALGLAISLPKEKIAQLLIKAGADINLTFDAKTVHDDGGDSKFMHNPLSYATQHGRYAVASALIDAGADLKSSLDYVGGPTPALLGALLHGNRPFVHMFVNLGAEINSEFFDGEMAALMWEWIIPGTNREDLVQLLVNLGVNVNIAIKTKFDRNQVTPLALAVEKSSIEVVRILVAAGADVNAPCICDGKKRTILYCAIQSYRLRNLDVVAVLIDAGADMNGVFTCEVKNRKTLWYFNWLLVCYVVDDREGRKFYQKLGEAGAKPLEVLDSKITAESCSQLSQWESPIVAVLRCW